MAKSKKERELEDSWVKIMAKHSKPLERGAKAKGVKAPYKPTTKAAPVLRGASSGPLPARYVKGSGTVPSVDVLAEAKRSMSHRIGQSYNKGGLVYLSDEELKEQTTGVHLRR